jgi:hypothetical protein
MHVISAVQEAEIRRVAVGAQLWQKVSKTPSQEISWAWWWYVSIILATWGGYR